MREIRRQLRQAEREQPAGGWLLPEVEAREVAARRGCAVAFTVRALQATVRAERQERLAGETGETPTYLEIVPADSKVAREQQPERLVEILEAARAERERREAAMAARRTQRPDAEDIV